MKLLATSLWIALATSAVAAEAPQAADPAPAEAASAPAPSAERFELARRFITLSISPDQFMDLVRAGVWQSAAMQIEDVEDETQMAAVEQEVEKLITLAEPTIHKQLPSIFDAYAQVYAREFSADELQQMIAFAQSPAGKHYMARFTDLEQDPLIMEAQEALGEALAPVLDQAKREKCAKQAAERLAAGDTNAKCRLSEESETLAS